ncbi:hypothetical protein O7614_24660 [Micromonospora sp. WMMD961]|uniref:hypothetical protein n=1 Tax=Micromonospora sp. WMMD961 TaxID=3016100 RepID=UPI002415A59F|nr:hypothetical protein [Micromonospora sp. WMMD961]MDG4782859.1 hypothetical protein [Micromonospora sp. WMMD961]
MDLTDEWAHGRTLADPGSFVVRLMAAPVAWLTALADDVPTLRRESVQAPTHSVEANLRSQERAYAWMTLAVAWGAAGVAVVLLIEPMVGEATADMAFGVVLFGVAFAMLCAGLSGLRAAVADRWGWIVFPGDAAEKPVRLRLARLPGQKTTVHRLRVRVLRWLCWPSSWDLLFAAVLATPFGLAGAAG